LLTLYGTKGDKELKILILDEWLPFPLENGKKIRTFNLLSRLAPKHEILYMCYMKKPADSIKLSVIESMGIRVIPVEDRGAEKGTLRFYLQVMLNMLSKKPFSSVYHIKKVFSRRLLEVIGSEKPDLIHCEWTNFAPFLEQTNGIPKLIVAHNVESEIWRRLSKNTSNPLLKIVAWQQAQRIEQLEKEWYPRVNQCIAVSERDSLVIRSYGASVTVIENGVDVDYYSIPAETVDRNRVFFAASFDSFSNQDAVEFFVKEILPRVRSVKPDISFWMVGKDPPDRLKRYAKKYPEVHFTGTVPDVKKYISKSAICMVPLRIGSGSRLKILEAMAMKKPVISTAIGAEGLRIDDGKNIILANRPDVFAAELLQLLDRPDQQRALGDKGFELVKSSYDWRMLAEKQNAIWEAMEKEN